MPNFASKLKVGMKSKLRKTQTVSGDNVLIPVISDKNDEFYIVSRELSKRIVNLTSIREIKLIMAYLGCLRYNDDRIALSTEQRKRVMDMIGIDRIILWRLTKSLIDKGILMKDGKDIKLPANLAFYGDKRTKINLIKSYASKGLKPNIKF